MNRDDKLVAVDWHGFIGVPAGTRLTFIISPEVLGYVDAGAASIRRSRSDVLLATTVGEEIDPAAPIFIEADLVNPSRAHQRGPLTFEFRVDGEDLGLQLRATQDPNSMPEGEACAVLIRIADEAGN